MMNILFLCTANSCRSQMAEGFARALAPAGVRVFSAGLAPGGVHPRALAVMAEAGVDLRTHASKDLSQVPVEAIDLVVTLCGEADATCPAFPGRVTRLHWPLPDPARVQGSEGDVLAAFRQVRDAIRARVADLFAVVRGEDRFPVVSRERVYSGRVINLDRERIQLPHGRIADLEILHHPGASAVVPLRPDHHVVMIRQYRHAAGGFILEVPAGKLDPGEAPDACARREVAEEVGLRAGRLHRLGAICTTPGFTDEVIHLFAATALEPVPTAHEHDEIIEVLTFPLARALDLVASGEIRDGKTICALVRTDQEVRAGRLTP